MTSNNEDRLRTAMARRLGRAIPEVVWQLATSQGYVRDAVLAGHAGEGGLMAFLRRQLATRDTGLTTAARRSSRVASGSAEGRMELVARTVALSRLAAEHAAGDEAMLQFRHEVLGRLEPLSATEARQFLEDRAPGSGPVLRYQNRELDWELRVVPGSTHDRLRLLGEALAASYPWEPAQATAFVLEGLVPLATPMLLHLPQHLGREPRPPRRRLVLEVDLWVPAPMVLRAYREAQRRVLPGHNRPLSRRAVDLVNFVQAARPATWPQLLTRWNAAHPTAPYADYRRMWTAYERARQALLFPRYRTWLGEQGQ